MKMQKADNINLFYLADEMALHLSNYCDFSDMLLEFNNLLETTQETKLKNHCNYYKLYFC